MNFLSDCYKNSYQLQDILTNFEFFTICVNHNEEHHDG
jgi:hypothetical protein